MKGIECDRMIHAATSFNFSHLGSPFVGGAQPRREAFVVVREEDGLGDLGGKSKEKHTQTQKNGGQTGGWS